MRKTVLIMIAGLLLSAGTVVALDGDVKESSDRIVRKLLDLTGQLNRRISELEKTVAEQKKEIAELKSELQQSETRNPSSIRHPGQTPELRFTPDGTIVPQQPRLWSPDGRVVPWTPNRQWNSVPPGSVPGEINGMRFFIMPVETASGSSTAGNTNPEYGVLPHSHQPVRTRVPASR